jgi:hypothetical protein
MKLLMSILVCAVCACAQSRYTVTISGQLPFSPSKVIIACPSFSDPDGNVWNASTTLAYPQSNGTLTSTGQILPAAWSLPTQNVPCTIVFWYLGSPWPAVMHLDVTPYQAGQKFSWQDLGVGLAGSPGLPAR